IQEGKIGRGLTLTLISQRSQGNGVHEKKKLGGIDSGSIDSIGEVAMKLEW
ncbi:hypothetical protein KI387_017274, partial [Taxus chinensis]